MIIAGLLILFFVFAAVSDFLSVLYHEAREHLRKKTASVYAMMLETLTWLPVLAAIEAGEGWQIALACVLGSGVGTYRGVARVAAKGG